MKMPKAIDVCQATEVFVESRLEKPGDPEAQGEALRHFTTSLLAKIEDNPQAVVDLLNRHFWELV